MIEGIRPQISKSPTLQKTSSPNESSSKNLVETKNNQNISSLGDYQGA
jgi:hypothetical protein